MNFDELKKQWDQQSEDNFNVDPNLNHYKSVGNILDKLRKNIKTEFIFWILAVIFLLFIPHINLYKIEGYTKIVYYFLIFQMTLAGIFYYKRFYYFYKSTKQFELLTSRENLLKLYYDLKFSVETYKMSTYMLMPQGVILYFIFFSYGHSGEWFEKLYNFSDTWQHDQNFIIFVTIGIVASILFLFVFTEWMIYHYYGKSLKMIKNILDSLEEE